MPCHAMPCHATELLRMYDHNRGTCVALVALTRTHVAFALPWGRQYIQASSNPGADKSVDYVEILVRNDTSCGVQVRGGGGGL